MDNLTLQALMKAKRGGETKNYARVLRGSVQMTDAAADLVIQLPDTPNWFCVVLDASATPEDGNMLGACFDEQEWHRFSAFDGNERNGMIHYWSSGTPRASIYNVSCVDGLITVPPASASILWRTDVPYSWEAAYYQTSDEIAGGVALGKQISLGADTLYGSMIDDIWQSFVVGENAKAYMVPMEAGGYRLSIVGSGATTDYKKRDARPWDGKPDEDGKYRNTMWEQIREIYIGGEISKIGDYLFARLSKATRLVNNSHRLVKIGKYAFYDCFGLTTAAGLSNIQTIGKGAFVNTPSLRKTDLSEKLVQVDLFGLHISSAQDQMKEAALFNAVMEDASTRQVKWKAETLQEIQSSRIPQTVILPVKAPDQQYYYNDIEYMSTVADGQYLRYAADGGGCTGLAMYHAYAAATGDHGVKSFREFWWKALKAETMLIDVTQWIGNGIEPLMAYINGVDAADGLQEGVELSGGRVWFHIRNFSGGTDDWEILGAMLRALGWGSSGQLVIRGAEEKKRILRAIYSGKPVLANVNHTLLDTGVNEAEHTVCIVGADAVSQKLVVVDSVWAAGTRGHVYKVAFEDLFYGDGVETVSNSIIVLEPGGDGR